MWSNGRQDRKVHAVIRTFELKTRRRAPGIGCVVIPADEFKAFGNRSAGCRPDERYDIVSVVAHHELIRIGTELPIAVGFGISRPEHVKAVWEEADGAVVGSSIVKEIEQHMGKPDMVEKVAAFAAWLKGGQ